MPCEKLSKFFEGKDKVTKGMLLKMIVEEMGGEDKVRGMCPEEIKDILKKLKENQGDELSLADAEEIGDKIKAIKEAKGCCAK